MRVDKTIRYTSRAFAFAEAPDKKLVAETSTFVRLQFSSSGRSGTKWGTKRDGNLQQTQARKC
jgi:hypothetical protein